MCLKGPSIQEVLVVVMIGTSVYGVVLIDGYLCSREYGIELQKTGRIIFAMNVNCCTAPHRQELTRAGFILMAGIF